jgi:hypothetical protein
LSLNAEFNASVLDKYREDLTQILIDTTNSIDDYFIDTNISKKNKTEAEIKTSFAMETGQKSEYAMRVKLKISLPKIQNRLRLIFEDEDSDDLLYDGTKLDNQYKVDGKNYFLRLDYFTYVKKRFKLTSGVGVKFRKFILHPYLNLKGRYLFDNNIIASNRFRIYTDTEYEDTFSLNKIIYHNNSIYTIFRNSFKYKSKTGNTDISNGVSATKVFNKMENMGVGLSFASRLKRLKSYFIYPQLYLSYRGKLYKNWIYYELNPSILWREENGYDSSYRFMFNIGMKFKKSK